MPMNDRGGRRGRAGAEACYQLLLKLEQAQLPLVVRDVEEVLALCSAQLIRADTTPTVLPSGERRVEFATVTAITPEGRAVCTARSRTRASSLR
ncbi:MAG: hypothetical protein EOO24_01265 [Comamonadaceae bacterium]|nr:MAG: hypothetical protein EOO24_01265 [Comamonadaceae bacterium]